MNLEVTQENLNKALSLVARVATGRATLPILSNILIQTIDNRLKVSATNLDIAISRFTGAKIKNEGSLTIPARLSQDFIANIPSGNLKLSQEDSKLHVKAENHQSTINGILADDYPVMPVIKNGTTWKLKAEPIKQALQQVIIAASHDETRPVLNGIFFTLNDKKIVLAATDSYRLAEKNLKHTQKTEGSFILPYTAAQELARILSDTNDEEILVTHDQQQVRFEVNDTELIARLIDGNYPDYQKLIPKDFETKATLNRDELISVTKVSSLFARESAGSIVLKANQDKGLVEIQSVASQVGENTATAAAKVTNSSEITLNARFLLEGLQVMEGEKVSINFNGKLQPVVLKDPDNDDYTHIVMPLKS